MLSSFVGRDVELAELGRLVAERQLVTATGPGGAGKTRLARELAARWDVAWFADLSGTTADGVADTIGAALGEDVVPSLDAPSAVARRRRGLLVLDNLEHLPDVGPPVAALVEACPDLRVLVTSRAPLRVTGEAVYEVPPLREDEAVRLFVERAAEAGAIVDDLGAAADICRQLDGLPLTIELAAARSRLLPPTELRHRVAHPLDTLVGGARRALARLGVFEGAFDLGSAEAMTGGPGAVEVARRRPGRRPLPRAAVVDRPRPGRCPSGAGSRRRAHRAQRAAPPPLPDRLCPRGRRRARRAARGRRAVRAARRRGGRRPGEGPGGRRGGPP